MKIVDLKQKSAEWLEWRRQGITATESAVLMGRSPYKTPWRLWAEKTGYALPEDLSRNPNILRGVQNEDKARAQYEKEHDDLVLPVCVECDQPFAHAELFRASLDGLDGENRPIEFKCPGERVWTEVLEKGRESEAVKLYAVQVQHQILCTGAPAGVLVFWHDGVLKEFDVQRDDALIQQLIEVGSDFWQKHIKPRKAPPLDPERDVYIPSGHALEPWMSTAQLYCSLEAQLQDLKEKVKELEASQKKALEHLKDAMGDFCTAEAGGVRVTKYVVAGRVDYTRLLDDKGISEEEAEKYRGKPSQRCRVTVMEAVTPRNVVDEKTVKSLKEAVPQEESFYW